MNTFKLRLLSVVVLASLLAVCSGSRVQARAGIIYVDRHATGLNNGTSWANAYTHLQSALSAATRDDEIWVAEGIYKPTSGTDRSISFRPVSDIRVYIYGGFAGTETALSQRDLTAHVTTLSGDIGTPGVSTDNSYHVVNADLTSAVVLDGFTIRDGYANDAGLASEGGGGLSYRLWAPAFLTLRHIIFRNNSARLGGAIYTNLGVMVLNQVTFEGNEAEIKGGGIYLNDGYLTIRNATFNGNSAQAGGGLYNGDHGIVTISNSTFYANRANNGPDMIADGAGIYNNGSLTVTFSTFSHNHAVNQGAGIFNSGTELILNNSILANSTEGRDCYGSFGVSAHHNLIEDNAPVPHPCGTPLLTSDPELGPLQNNGGFTPTMALLRGSPAIDVGDAASCPDFDQRGMNRPRDGDNNYIALCDIGAYEREPAPGVGVYDDVHDGWTYTDFTARTSTEAYDGTFHHSNIVGGTAEFVFNGSQIILMYSKYRNRGELDVYIDDVLVTTINQYNATRVWQASWMSDDLGPGFHSVRLVHAGPSDSIVDIDAIEVMTYTAPKEAKYDDGDSGWKYNNFIAAKMTGPYLGTFHYSKAVGSMAEFVFTGSQITLWYSQYSNRGKLAVYIDDKQTPMAIIDQYNATRVWQASWMSDDLGPGLHRVRLVHASGAMVDIDAIEIFP